MAGHPPKSVAHHWVNAARLVLVEEGASGLKVDRLAARLGVARSAFYYRFKNRHRFLVAIIAHWKESCRFGPREQPTNTADLAEWIEHLFFQTAEASEYDRPFDLAMREWGRTEKQVAWAIERADRKRQHALAKMFEAIGHDSERAAIRARILYCHQVGFYAAGARKGLINRNEGARICAEILCGPDPLADASKRPGLHPMAGRPPGRTVKQ